MLGLAITYGLTGFGSIAALFNPFYGLLAYVAMAVLKPEQLWFYSVPQSNYGRILGIAMLLGWALHGFGDRKLGKGAGAMYALLAFLAWAGISAAFAPVPGPAWEFVEALAKIVLPVLVGVTTITSRRQLQLLAWTIVASQGYMAFEMNLYYFSGYNRLRVNGFAGLDNNAAAIGLNAAIGVGFFLGLHEKNVWRKGLAWFFCLMMVHACFFSFSRGGMLGACVTGAVAFLLIPRRTEHYLALAIALLIGLRMAGPEVTERFLSTFVGEKVRDESAASRIDLWMACAKATAGHPLLGLGPNQWILNAHHYGFEEGKAAHSTWMEMAAELGLPGVSFLVGFYGLAIFGLLRLGRRIRRYGGDDFGIGLGGMVISSLMGFGVSAQFVTVENLEVPYYVAMLGACTLKVYGRSLWEPGGEPWTDWDEEIESHDVTEPAEVAA